MDNIWQKLLGSAIQGVVGITKPFAKGANILAQGYGDLYRGLSGKTDYVSPFEQYVRSGITQDEQQRIEDTPYLEMLKSGAGMAGTLAPVAGDSFRTAQIVSKTLPNKWLQSILQGTLEGSLRGFSDSETGQEGLGATKGALMGIGGELAGRYLGDKSFREMLKDRNLADIEDVVDQASNIYQRNLQTPQVPNTSSRPFRNIQDLQNSMGNYMGTVRESNNLPTVQNVLSKEMGGASVPTQEYRDAILDLLDSVGLQDYPQELQNTISRLSGVRGGERQIFNLIRDYVAKAVSGV